MARIVAIGGGEIGRPGSRVETLELDAEVVGLTGKRRPRAVFLPTATVDDLGYVDVFTEHYGRRLGCDVTALLLYDRSLRDVDIEQTLRRADIVYVGGGNTLRMMNLWRRRGVDELLRRSSAHGTVLAGISAGAICWCSFGVSDSRSFGATDDSWSYIAVRGLGLVDVALCPHFDSEPNRRAGAAAVASRRRLTTVCLDDCAALQVVDDSWRILSSRDGSGAHLIDRSGSTHDLPAGPTFRELSELVGGQRASRG